MATVGSTSITLAEVDDKALEQPAANFGSVKLGVALYQARRAALDELVANTLMDSAAKTEGIARPALIEREITSKIRPVTDDDVAFWYQANQARVQGAPLDQVRAPIRAYLIQERMAGARAVLRHAQGQDTGDDFSRPAQADGFRREGRDQRKAERADRNDRVLGFSVPVLPARARNG